MQTQQLANEFALQLFDLVGAELYSSFRQANGSGIPIAAIHPEWREWPRIMRSAFAAVYGYAPEPFDATWMRDGPAALALWKEMSK